MPQFKYGSVEIAHLKNRDPLLGAVIDRIGPIERADHGSSVRAMPDSAIAQEQPVEEIEMNPGRRRNAQSQQGGNAQWRHGLGQPPSSAAQPFHAVEALIDPGILAVGHDAE